MRAVGGTEAVIAEETVRRNEIDVFVGLHPGSDLGLTGLLLGGLVSIRLLVEITFLPADCLKEDQRSLGMSLTDDATKLSNDSLITFAEGFENWSITKASASMAAATLAQYS